MKVLFINTLLGFILAFTAFSSAAYKEDPIETGFFNNKAIYGYDTVAYFTQGKPVKGEKNMTSDWRGATWYFSNAEHKSMFDKNPEKFAPQYGGYCAYAMARGDFVGIDKDAFTIHNDKLYLNYSKSVSEDWLADKDGFITSADIEYPAKVDL